MTRLRSPLLGLLLALVMVLTSQSMAAARTMPGPSGQIELCTGSGPLMVSVDDQGQPVGLAHICPDFAAHAFDIGGGVATATVAARTLRALRFVVLPRGGQSQTVPVPQARGPPILV